MKKLHTIACVFILLAPSMALGADNDSTATLFPATPSRVWQIDWSGPAQQLEPVHTAIATATFTDIDQTAPPPRAFEYSHGYQVRAKIHKYASFATLPLFATEIALGQSLYDNPGGTKKTAHAIVGAGIGSLFAINTVTGVWNLMEARKDPAGRKRRMTHGLLMMAANAGFFATFLAAPDAEHGDFTDARSTHRTLALTSIGVATAGYLTMMLGGK